MLDRNLEKLEALAKAWEGKEALLLAYLLQRLSEERESTIHLLKGILQRLEKIERALEVKEEKAGELLAEQDEAILRFIRERGRADAEEVRLYMGYRGSNAASARLNRLVEKGLLKKKRVGKKVVFVPA